jgi:hypothetical protein
MSGYIFLIAGAVNYVAAVLFFWRSYRRISTWVSVEGIVVDLESDDSADSVGSSPVAQFATADEEQRTFTGDVAATWYRIGQKVEVIYCPGNPDRAAINDGTSMWGIALIGSAAGTVFWCLAFLSW